METRCLCNKAVAHERAAGSDAVDRHRTKRAYTHDHTLYGMRTVHLALSLSYVRSRDYPIPGDLGNPGK